MKFKSLQLGNIVQSYDSGICEIVGIYNDLVDIKLSNGNVLWAQRESEIFFVPLNPYWLIKLGYVQNFTLKNLFHFSDSKFRYDIKHMSFDIICGEKNEYESIYYRVKIKWVHELQNTHNILSEYKLVVT